MTAPNQGHCHQPSVAAAKYELIRHHSYTQKLHPKLVLPGWTLHCMNPFVFNVNLQLNLFCTFTPDFYKDQNLYFNSF